MSNPLVWHARPLVLFGAGALGRRTLRSLRAAGVEPLVFCDNNPQLQHSAVDGLRVLSVAEGARLYGESAVFVICIWNAQAADRMRDRAAQLRAAGCKTVIAWPHLHTQCPNLLPHYAVDAPHKLALNQDAIRRCAALWEDEASHNEYFAQLRWRQQLDFDALSDPIPGPAYFREELFRIDPGAVFVDCGAYDGDTIQAFVAHTQGRFQHIHAFEPDPANFAKLPTEPRLTKTQAAVTDADGVISFQAEGTAASAACHGDSEVACVRLDTALADIHPTLIKMDIEGSEPQALAGAREILRRDAPVLAISVYHAQDHLWRIPLQIHTYQPAYRFYLRPHGPEGWDLVCYAIPDHHAVRPPSTTSTEPVI